MLRRPIALIAALFVAGTTTSAIEPASAHVQVPVVSSMPREAKLVAKSGTKSSALTNHVKAVKPVKVYRKTSLFKERSRLYGSRGHSGVDLAAPRGISIYAVQPGRVTFAGWDGDYGRKIVVDHGRGMVTVYGHLNSISVKRGQVVNMGKRIGTVGTSGRTTGPHLHFELRRHGQISDPSRWLESLGVRL